MYNDPLCKPWTSRTWAPVGFASRDEFVAQDREVEKKGAGVEEARLETAANGNRYANGNGFTNEKGYANGNGHANGKGHLNGDGAMNAPRAMNGNGVDNGALNGTRNGLGNGVANGDGTAKV